MSAVEKRAALVPGRVHAQHFDALLERLGAEGSSGVAYEALRLRLLALFRRHYAAEAEQLADETLDRLARRVAEGVDIGDLRYYALGIARLVLQEAKKQAVRQRSVPIEELPLAAPEPDDGDIERVHAALSQCMAQMDAAAAKLILDYYGGSGDGGDTGHIRLRRRLAEALGLKPNALRNRALRLRAALEDCVRDRLRANT